VTHAPEVKPEHWDRLRHAVDTALACYLRENTKELPSKIGAPSN
jgi:hypothetical protein